MAKINNNDPTKKSCVIGVGDDKDNILDWCNDIHFTYNVRDNDRLNRAEFKKFIDHTLKVGNMVFIYTRDDFEDLFHQVDVVNNGFISRI